MMKKTLNSLFNYIVVLLFLGVAVSGYAQQQTKGKWVAPKRPKVKKWVAPKQNGPVEVIDVWRPYYVMDNWSLEVQGGVSAAMSENYTGHGIMDMLGPTGGLAIAKQTSSLFSTRFALNYARQVGWVADGSAKNLPSIIGDGHYPFGMTEAFLDERINLTNMLFKYSEKRRLDMLLFVGVGGNYAWGIDKNTKLWEKYGEQYVLDRTDHINMAVRGGVQFLYKASPSVDVSLQGAYKMIGDSYNGQKHTDKFAFDPVVDVSVGVVLHLVDHYGDYRYKKVHRSEANSLRGQIVEVAEFLDNEKEAKMRTKEAAEVVEYGKLMKTAVSFYTDRAYVNDDQMENLRIVADFLKAHPDVNLIVRGYNGASRGSESPDMQLAERRVEAVKKALIRHFNVDQSRFTLWFDEEGMSPYPMQGEWIDAVVFEMVKR